MTEARADVTMMYLLHDAMRRDLDRLRTGLARLAVRPEVPLRAAIGACWAEFAANVHHHHTSEDTKVWPVLRERVPAAGALLTAMEAEHAAVGPAMNDAGTAVRAVTTDNAQHTRAAVAAVDRLRRALLPHLEHEEQEALPIIEAHLAGPWEAFEKRQQRDAGLAGLTRFLPWVLDDAEPQRAAWLRARLPAPVRLVVVRVFLPRRRRAVAPLLAVHGTRDAARP